MRDLLETNSLVLAWPPGKPMPRIGDEIDAGALGLACVTSTQEKRMSRSDPIERLVEITLHHRITLEPPNT